MSIDVRQDKPSSVRGMAGAHGDRTAVVEPDSKLITYET